MRRRVMNVKRLPSKKSKTPEVPQTSNYLHFKLVCGWGVVVLLDAVVGFRLEYLYPAIMFLRSVLDSYKYQGLVFSLFFILLVLYLDVVCWTLLIGPWLFLIASSCVWLELIRNWDSTFGYTSILLWMFFLYVEISQRLNFLPPSIITLLRPFGAHCIGYPVVAMSFQLKHQLTHVIRQRQQRQVSEENSRCFDILNKALPISEDDEGAEEKLSLLSDEGSGQNDIRSKGSVKTMNKKEAFNKGYGLNSKDKSQNNKSTTAKTAASVVGVVSKRDPSPSSKSQESKNSSGTNSPSLSSSLESLVPNGTVTHPILNGDVVRPPSAGKMHPPPVVGKKQQALVKAVPRTDLQQQMEAREKAAKSTEALLMELKDERLLRNEAEEDIIRLEKEVKRLQADLHASSLQEEEANQRIVAQLQQERLTRVEIQRLRNENEALQNRLVKLTSSKTQDLENISSLEDQLKQEMSLRRRVEIQLREQRSQASTQNQWSKEEIKEMKDKLAKKDKELSATRDEVQQFQRKCQSLNQTIMEKKKEYSLLEEKHSQLKMSLADETRVKIELFQYLSDARKKQEGFIEELKKKDQEIESLKQKMQQLVALQSTWTPSLSPHH